MVVPGMLCTCRGGGQNWEWVSKVFVQRSKLFSCACMPMDQEFIFRGSGGRDVPWKGSWGLLRLADAAWSFLDLILRPPD